MPCHNRVNTEADMGIWLSRHSENGKRHSLFPQFVFKTIIFCKTMFISVFKNDLVNKYLNVSVLSFPMGSISHKQKNLWVFIVFSHY